MGQASRPISGGNLPDAVTSFVGRRHEVGEARRRLGESRLLTLVGTGGVGKTRLALQVAADARKAFRDGVWLVELAGLADPCRVGQAVVAALGLRDQSARPAEAQLAGHLAGRQALIVLDNCEHLVEGCSRLVASLLPHAPGVRVLATSREPLGIGGEQVMAVPPLSCPAVEQAPPAEALAAYDAVRLLVERARCVQPDFTVEAGNAEAVARLCALLDGLPLAIELAAVRLRSLDIGEIVARLGDRFVLLTGGSRVALPRQQSLRALIDWSFSLCTPEQQSLWARLSVFAGSFDLAATEAVCAGDGVDGHRVVDLLDHLVAKSIVVADRSGPSLRYRMLMTVRDYGSELLAGSGTEAGVRQRHCEHYLGRARAMVAAWAGPGQAAALASMRQEHANLLAALEWTMDGGPGGERPALALAAALRYHWVVGGFLNDGRRWLDRALECSPQPSVERGEALWVAAWVSMLQGDLDVAHGRLAECTAMAATLADDRLAAHAAHWSGLVALFRGDVDGSVGCLRRAVSGHQRVGDAAALLTARFQLIVALAYAGRLEEARQTADDGMRLSEESGERWARAYVLWAAGLVEWHRGDLDAVSALARETLTLTRDFRDAICAALAIELLAWVASAQSSFEDGARLLGAARAVWGEIGTSMAAFGVHLGADSERGAARAAEALGEMRFEALVAEGATLDIESAIGRALGGPVASSAAGTVAARPLPAGDSPLSKREEEVAALVSAGLSNRAIAETLVVSARTVESHVEHILAKLGFTSRSQVAAWVARRQ